ncbi:MAG: methylated-DNA--[protein]-cysteine S-methyltransferase [Halobacteriota archaeon]
MMKETTCLYSEFLAQFVHVVLEDGVIQQVELGPSSRPNSLHSAKSAVKALANYLRGDSVDLSAFPVNLDNHSKFERATLQCTREIPRGSVVTYSELAAKVGNPRAARAVGNALHRNPVPLFVPCHRVVGVSGLGGYAWGLEIKQKLLSLEGVHLPVKGTA